MMESTDVRVLRTARDWLAAGHPLQLVTVVRTWGSSPRPAGSMMVMREDGRCVGSVSGGCIEDDLIQRYSRIGGNSIPQSAPERVRYGVTADEALRAGLIHRVVAADLLDGEVAGFCAEIGSNAPLTITASKRAIDSLAGRPVPDDPARL